MKRLLMLCAARTGWMCGQMARLYLLAGARCFAYAARLQGEIKK